MRLHEALSELEWREGLTLDSLQFLVVDRGAPDGVRLLCSPELEGRDRSYLQLASGGRIPYHRVLEVRSDETVLWSKRSSGGERAPQ